MFSFAAIYSAISLCTSRWFGARFVITAMCGERFISSSWNDESSDDREVFRLHLLRVAAAADGRCCRRDTRVVPRRAQHFGDDARCGGLAVAAGHADDRTWADLEKRPPFRDVTIAAARFRLEQRRNVRPHARACGRRRPRADRRDNASPKCSCAPSASSCGARSAERLAALFVAGDDLHTVSRTEAR